MCTSVLAKFVAELEPKSQKGLSPWNHSTLRLPVALLYGTVDVWPYCPRHLTETVRTLEHRVLWAGFFLFSLLSAASDVYYIALYKHICIYAPCDSIARICDGALNTNANLCNCVRVYVQVLWCVLICNAVACRATLSSPPRPLSFFSSPCAAFVVLTFSGWIFRIYFNAFIFGSICHVILATYVCTRVCVCVLALY